MPESGFLKRPADKADIVGSTASASRLADNDGKLIGVIFAGQDGLHDLADYHQRWIAGIIIHICKPHIYRLLIVVGQHLHICLLYTSDFSDEDDQSGVGMAVKKDSDIDSYEDLKGNTVAAKLGTEGWTFAGSIADQYGFTVTQFEDSSTMYQDVISGNTVACFEDYPVMGYEISRGLELKLPLDMEKGAPYGFAVMKGENAELLKMFKAGLANLKESGKYDEILDTYIKK